MERVMGLLARSHPPVPAEEGFQQVGVEGLRLSLAQAEDVERCHCKRECPDHHTGRRVMLMREHEGQTEADHAARQQEEDIDPLDAPDLPIAVITRMGRDHVPAHCPTLMVGIPPALKSA